MLSPTVAKHDQTVTASGSRPACSAARLAQQGVAPDRAVVADHGLAVPEPAHQTGEVLHLRCGDASNAVGVEQRSDPPADAQDEPSAPTARV